MGNSESEEERIARENRRQAEAYEAAERERRRQEEERRKRTQIEKEKQEEIRRQLELELARERERRRQEEVKRKERERRIKEENDRYINKLRQEQDISFFLTLITKYTDEYKYDYLIKTLEALNENAIKEKYNTIKEACKGKITLIENTLYNENRKGISSDCLRKLTLLLLFYQQNSNRCDLVFKKFLEKVDLKELIFNILLDYGENFGNSIKFENEQCYKEFVDYSLQKGKYVQSLKYRSNDVMQLNILYEKREEIFNSYKVTFNKLNVYSDNAFNVIQKIIDYQNEKKRKFVFFEKSFWENYYTYYYKNLKENLIDKLVELYNQFLSYIKLKGEKNEKDVFEYKETLAKNIHDYIEKIIKEDIVVKNQLELLLKKDPYYIYDNDKREPEIFKDINILNLTKEDEIKYFQEINFEIIYSKNFKNYLDIIIEKIEEIKDFISIIKLIKLNEEKNKIYFIELLVKRYSNFKDDELTDESFMNFLEKALEYKYTLSNILNLLENNLPRFKQNYIIYIQILVKYKHEEIRKLIATSSYKNLELKNFVELIRNIKEEELKKDFFNNISENIITKEDFLQKENTKNLSLLTELMKNKLIPDSIYLDDNTNILDIIYYNLSNFIEKKQIYLDTILNENEEIQNIYAERFQLFKLAQKDLDSKQKFNEIKQKYMQDKEDIEKAKKISFLLDLYYKNTFKEEIDKIKTIYKDYLDNEKQVNTWVNKDKEDIIKKFINKHEDKANLIKEIKEIELFKIIYEQFTEGDETKKFDESKKLLDECKIIFTDIYKGNKDILDKWQEKFKKERGINEELKKLKKYYNINDKDTKEDKELDKVAKNILIFTKKNIYYDDIKYILKFIRLFEAKETELSKNLTNKILEFEDKDLDFEKLEKTNNYLEKLEIYENEGKDDSPSIKLIRYLQDKKEQIEFAKQKDVDSAAALMYRLNPTTDSLQFNDIVEYQSCVAFILDIYKKEEDEKLLSNLKEKLKKDNNIDKVLSRFKSYFINYSSIKALDENFDSSKDIYENIKDVLNNSEFEIELFKREFKVKDENNKEKEIIAKDLDGLIQLKDNINLNFEDPPESKKEEKEIEDEKTKEKKEKEAKRNKELKEKKEKIEIFVRYIERLQSIIKYFTHLEKNGCPFSVEVTVTAKKDNIKYILVNTELNYEKLIFKLKEYCNALVRYQSKFYKENEYFRFVYEKQLYRLYKRIRRKDKDISSYVRFFTNGESTKDDVPYYESKFNDPSYAYKYYKEAIEEKFQLISNYIKNIFKVNGTSLEKLYKYIEVKETSLKGIYKCNVKKYNMDQFIIKMFIKFTGAFPIAQNVLLTNNETSKGEIYSFMYRAIKCRFHTLFIISISDDFSIQNVNIMTNLMNQIISDMKGENKIKKIEDLEPCILFITQNQKDSSKGVIDFPEITDLPKHYIGDENKLEYNFGNDDSLNNNNASLRKSQLYNNDNINNSDNKLDEIYNNIKVYTSECSGLGKSEFIKKEIEDNKEEYYYLGIGDDITKEYLYKKLKRFLKKDIRGKYNVGVHLNLFYTKNINLMKYFLFSFLISKLYQANDNILYIPKNIKIYVEIPNGPQQFLDDFPILKIFKLTNILLKEQKPLNIHNEDLRKKLAWTDANIEDKEIIIEENNSKEDSMTYIEKKIYMNIISYLSSNKEEDKNKYYEKVKNIAKYFTKCVYSEKLRKPDVSQNNKTEKEIKEYIFDFLDVKEDEVKIHYDTPLIFKTKNGYVEVDISDKEVNGKDLKYFLENLKRIMSLDETIEDIERMLGDYIIIEDNYKKMVLILFRIFTNIPVILMGETGCGKTELIKQLMKMLHKGDMNFLITKNMHSGVKESEIIEIIEKAEKKLDESKSDIICVFFDEINTTSLLSIMKEIFVNHSLNGKAINEKIRFIGACNPFRKKEEQENNIGLKLNEGGEEMTYLVNPLPNSLLYYIFYFKSLDENDVKKYIESIIGEEFPKGENEESKNTFFRNIAIDTIFKSHQYVRKINGKSSVSLRDLQRFKRAYKFFNKYYENKETFMRDKGENISEKVKIQSKIQSFVLSIFITYYIRILNSGNKDENKESGSKNEYLGIINPNILNLAKSFDIKEWMDNNNWKKDPFLTIVKGEEEFLLEEMGVKSEKGIGLNTSLKQNIFLMFFSIYSHIPLIIVGKPGCSKSLSIQLIIRYMRGEFSDSNFLKKYPKINSTGFQGSETNTPESIENIFKEAEKKIDNSKVEKVLSLLVYDELGLSEKSPTNCLKVLHSKLEMSLDPNGPRQISFIGISNWKLDAAKMNRTIFLSIPEIGLDDVGLTVKAIADSYDKEIYLKYEEQYNKLGLDFYKYIEELKKSNDEFYANYHGGRDLYHLVKIFSSEIIKNNKTDDTTVIDMAIKKSFARNLNGLEINGESTLKKYIKDINCDNIGKMDLIIDNIKSKDSRFLLLISEKSMFDFLMNIIKTKLEQMNYSSSDKINYVSYIGSPFKGDRMNVSYQTEMIVNIENSVAEGKVIVLSNLEQIYSIFYDLFNQNYITKDNKKYCRISHGANIQKLALVNENTKFIILVDKNDLRKQKLPFLSRFEKHIITFDVLLNEEDKKNSKSINDLLKKIVCVKDINYNIDNILVNTNEDIINGYVYFYKDKSYKNIIEDKIIPIMPQDIIYTLPFSELRERSDLELIKKKYSDNRYKSLDEYLKSEKRGKENILIIYTFSKIGESINLYEKESYMEIIASEIKNVSKFKQILNEFYETKKYKTLMLKFTSENAIYINYFISEIKHYNDIRSITDENKKYIFTVNIQREFNSKKTNKITTVLITNENINQLFIDNINGAELSIKDIEGKNIEDYINKGYLDPKKLILEEMFKFYGEKKDEQMGKYKGIDTNNFIQEFKNFIEKSDLVKEIQKIILSQMKKNEKIVDLIIEKKSINQNTIDFTSAILTYLKEEFQKILKILLGKAENNNFFTTLFMLNKDKEKENPLPNSSSNQVNDYSFNKTDEQLLKNELFNKIIKQYLFNLREKINEKNDASNADLSVNIKLYYKIPGFFNVYREMKKYIKDEKFALYYKQDEGEIRKCEYGLEQYYINKLRNDVKEFTDKLYVELASKQILSEVIKTNINDKNYIEFTEVFLNDYITFYLVNLYKNQIHDFVVNDIPHKIILLLLDLKFKDLKEDEKYEIPLQNNVSKILWLEGNANYIKDMLELYNIISENIVYDEKEEEYLFKEILNHISENKIKYEPKEFKLVKVNVPYYIFTIALFKCMIDKKSINNAISKNDNYYSYFENLNRCLKEMQKLDKSLKMDIEELSILNEFINIYNVFEHTGKINKLDINKLITNLTKSLEIIENNEESRIEQLCDNLKSLIEIVKEVNDSSKNKKIKGDEVYYELIVNILLNELKRENSQKYKIYILKEQLLEDEKLFIQSTQLLKIILEDFVTSNIDLFQGSLDNLSNSVLEILEKKINNDWIKETLIYTFEQISIIYIQNLINENEKNKKENKKNILFDLKSFFGNCIEILEKIFKDPKLENEDDKVKTNICLKKIFALSSTRVYLKTFIDWIDKNQFKPTEIDEIIDVINGKETNEFRDVIRYFIYKIVYNKNQKEIGKFFDTIDKYHFGKYKNFDLIDKEKNSQESAKHIVFVETYKTTDNDFKIFKEEFDLLTYYLENSGDKEDELKKLIKENRLDIFYSVFSTKISAHLSSPSVNEDKIKLLSNIIHNIFDGKEKLINIFDLFLDISKYDKVPISPNIAEILQFSLKYCINADNISDEYDNMYYPLYCNDMNINSYIPGNDIKDRKIYDCYSKIKKFLNENPSNYGVYICTCSLNEDNKDIYLEFIKGNGYPTESGKCDYCGEPTGKDEESNGFYERDSYYRIFKNSQDLEKEIKNKEKGNCITLEKFFEDYISEKLEKDSKGVNASKKTHFDKEDKPIRNQSQLCYRLMNLILYSHLFTNVLFNQKDEIFVSETYHYLNYIQRNWNKLNKILDNKGLNIYVFMNLIYKDLSNYLNKQKQIENYKDLLEVEKEIENIIENNITKKTQKIKDKEFTKYQTFGTFYKDIYREKDSKYISIIKESNNPEIYNEKEYPYYKSFLYSDYPDETFLKNKFEEIDSEKYPVIDLYLNREKQKKGLSKEFIYFNFVIKSLLNQYSFKISRNEAKKLTFEKTNAYKEHNKICEKFIKMINDNCNLKLAKESYLENFFVSGETEIGGLYKQLYNKYAKIQNDLIEEIVKKINAVNFDTFECREINIQEAQREDLIILEFENKNQFTEILLTNISREIYNDRSKIKYNNYNLFSIDFDKIEKLLEDTFIRNACLLKTDEIVEIKYTGEDFLDDGIYEFNKNFKSENLNEKDKKDIVNFYEENLKSNLISCLEVNEGIKNIIKYANKNNKNINVTRSVNNIINQGAFHYKLNDNLKSFLNKNTNVQVSKLSNLMIFIEKLYFESAINQRNEYTVKLEDKIKKDIDTYYEKKSGQLITKDRLSVTIIRFLLNVLMNEKNDKTGLVEENDNLFNYLGNQLLWNDKDYKDPRFAKEMDEFKKLNILVKNSLDFYSNIASSSKNEFDNEMKDLSGRIMEEKKEKLENEKQAKREEERKKIEQTKNDDENNAQDVDDDDIDDITDF